MSLVNSILAAAKFAAGVPWQDVIAAIEDPSSLAKDAQVAEDLVGLLPLPPLEGAAIELAMRGFVALVQASGGGTITPGSSLEGQTQASEITHGKYIGR